MTSDTSPPSQPGPGFYSSTQLQPENSVGYLMRKVMTSIRTQADAQLASLDLTYAQWLPLFKISLCTQTTVASLARDLETDPASMTRALDRLEAKGLVARQRSTTDRRVVQLALTEAGTAAAAGIPAALSSVQNAYLAGFSQEEFDTLKSMLRRIVDNAQALNCETSPADTSKTTP